MSADKELLNSAAILTAIRLKTASPCESDAEGVMEVFDEMYDYLDCYSRHKNEREPMGDIKEWLKEFYSEHEEDAAAHPRWHRPIA